MHLDQVQTRLPSRRRVATHEMVAEVLREAIATGHLKASQPLPQDEIASQLHVSHIPVREALRQLQSEGLVTYQPNRGATVSALSPGEIREIYEIRAILETAAVRRAAIHLAAGKLDLAERMLDLAEADQDGAAWGSHDVEFHQLIYDLDQRPHMRELIDGLLRRVDRYWLIQGLMLRHRATFDREHRALLAAIRQQDGPRAAAILEAHLAGAATLLATAVEQSEATAPG